MNNGLLIEGTWYYSKKDIFKIFDYIKGYNPGFFNIIDRLQLELSDNIERLSNDLIYMDSASQEIVFLNGELNIMVFLYNNTPQAKEYRIRINAPGFDPNSLVVNVQVEGRGHFSIPRESIPFCSERGDDIVGTVATILENGDTVWLTLEPKHVGEQTIQIFLESKDGIVIEGKTRAVRVVKDIKTQIKKITSLFSIIGGLAAPLSRMLLVA